MKRIYQIGTHFFETEEEYLHASKDYEYIQKFMKELDLHKAYVAKELYLKLEQSDSLMKSPVGEAFKEKLVQVFVAEVVKQKKELLVDTETQTLRNRIRRATIEPWMQWYWRSFLLCTLLIIMYLLLTMVCTMGDWLGTSSLYQILYQEWILLTLYSGYFYALMILASIVLLGITVMRMLHKKVETMHKLNLLLSTGFLLCMYLYVVTSVRQGIFRL